MTKLVSWKDEKLTRGLVGVYIRGDKVMLYSVLPVTMAKQTLVQEHATKVLNYALMQVIYSHYLSRHQTLLRRRCVMEAIGIQYCRKANKY